MMNSLFFCCAIIALMYQPSQACHGGEGHRRKRQVNANDPDVENTSNLRQYFANCLTDGVGDIWDWQSVIDTTILDTFWYEGNDESNCSESNNDDTAECWQSRLREYLQSGSNLMRPSMECIERYASDVARGIFDFTTTSRRQKRSSNAVEEDDEPFLNSPEVRQYSSCIQGQVQFPPNRDPLDFPSVFQFIEGHTICSSELNDCDENEEETLSGGDEDVPSWPYRFEAITKTSSPLRSSISCCNDLVFPINSDQWGEWGSWGSCSLTCGRGTRRRSRQCSGSSCVGSSIGQIGCNTQVCGGQWGEWGSWSSCSRTCGGGTRTSVRQCSGSSCVGSKKKRSIFNIQDGEGQWGEWGSWGSCSLTCGRGTRRRSRQCSGSSCVGSSIEQIGCNTQVCEGS